MPVALGAIDRDSGVAGGAPTFLCFGCKRHTGSVWSLRRPPASLPPPLQGVFTLCDPTRERPWQRAALIDDAVDHITVAEAADHGALAALEVLAARCEWLGVPDATVSEVLRSWLACRG